MESQPVIEMRPGKTKSGKERGGSMELNLHHYFDTSALDKNIKVLKNEN